MTEHVAFLMKDLVLFGASFYLLKQDVVRAKSLAGESAVGRDEAGVTVRTSTHESW